MFNLLPENLKKSIRSEYNQRRIVLIFVFVLIIETLFFAMLLPSWFASVYKEKQLAGQTEKMNQYLSTLNIGPVTEVIKTLNQKMLVVTTTLEYQSLVPLMDSILSKKTDAISITGITYASQSAETATMVVKGVSDTRDALVAFSKALESSGTFKTVDLPISNLAKDRNINFTISMTIDVKK